MRVWFVVCAATCGPMQGPSGWVTRHHRTGSKGFSGRTSMTTRRMSSTTSLARIRSRRSPRALTPLARARASLAFGVRAAAMPFWARGEGFDRCVEALAVPYEASAFQSQMLKILAAAGNGGLAGARGQHGCWGGKRRRWGVDQG